MIKAVEEKVRTLLDKRSIKTKPLTEDEFGVMINRKKSAVSQLKKGNVKTDTERWDRMRKYLRAFIVGTTQGENHPATHVADRLCELFFEPAKTKGLSKDPLYFSQQSFNSHLALRPPEVKYLVLDLANRSLRDDYSIVICIVSGGTRFGNVTEEHELTDIPRACLAAAGAGAHMYYVYPDPKKTGDTPASHSAATIKERLKLLSEGTTWPEQVECLFHDRKDDEKKRRLRESYGRMHWLAISPDRIFETRKGFWGHEARSDDTNRLSAAQFLSPIVRFVFYKYCKGKEHHHQLLLARHIAAEPRALECDKQEADQFLTWMSSLEDCQSIATCQPY
jgi:hypothetical protein